MVSTVNDHKEYLKDMAIVANWATAVTELEKAENRVTELRAKVAELEKSHKFLGNLKGAIKKVSSRSTSSAAPGDALPSASKALVVQQKQTGPSEKSASKEKGRKDSGEKSSKKRKQDTAEEIPQDTGETQST